VKKINSLLHHKSVMIIAGEASGDLHGSNLVKAIRRRDNEIFFCGIGGAALEREGVDLFFNIRALSVMGITEVLSKLPAVYRALKEAKRRLKTLHPDLLILIDFPEFNLKVAKAAKKFGVPVLYYISPKVWAWRSGRVKKIKTLVNHMAIILPFEQDFYQNHDIPVTYVGHPLLDTVLADFPPRAKDDTFESSVIGLLPGSREKEIIRILPVMIDSAKILSTENGNLKFLISVAASIDQHLIEKIVNRYKESVNFDIVTGGVHEIFKETDFVVAASGTVVLEAAIAGVPMVVLYKMSAVSHWFAKAMVRLKHFSLVNLIAGKEVVPELLQNEVNPENIAHTVSTMLNDTDGLNRVKNELYEIKRLLGGAGASDRVAEIAMRMM